MTSRLNFCHCRIPPPVTSIKCNGNVQTHVTRPSRGCSRAGRGETRQSSCSAVACLWATDQERWELPSASRVAPPQEPAPSSRYRCTRPVRRHASTAKMRHYVPIWPEIAPMFRLAACSCTSMSTRACFFSRTRRRARAAPGVEVSAISAIETIRGFREGRISGSSQPLWTADETEFWAGESSGVAGREGHPSSDAPAVLGRREDQHRAGRRARRGEHRRTVPARGGRLVNVS